MNIVDNKSQIKNLEALYSKIHISKISTIKRLLDLKQHQTKSMNLAMSIKEIFEYCEKKFKIKSFFYDGAKDPTKYPTLFIYFSAKKNLLSVNNNSLQETIEKTFNKEKDYLITVGEEAKKFGNKFKNLVHSFVEKQEIKNDLAAIILSLFRSKTVGSVKVIIHSQRLDGKPLIILPLNKLEDDRKKTLLNKNLSYSFYPDLTNSLQQLFERYTYFVIRALIIESDFYVVKQKLFKHTSSEKTIEDKITWLKRQSNKVKQEKLTNDILLLTSNRRESKDPNSKKSEHHD